MLKKGSKVEILPTLLYLHKICLVANHFQEVLQNIILARSQINVNPRLKQTNKTLFFSLSTFKEFITDSTLYLCAQHDIAQTFIASLS